MTYQVYLVRRDGGAIIFHLSTEYDPEGASGVTASRVPLTIEQMTAIVRSGQW